MNNSIHYQFLYKEVQGTAPAFSLKPEDSDFVLNQLVLNSLVATLVKYDNSGRIEPYLASEWTTNADETEWAFKVRSDLMCEDGIQINASSFLKGLLVSLKRNVSKASRTEFELLDGWSSFINAKEDVPRLPGIRVDGDLLIFKFRSRPGSLLNFLRMPYFGYWCESNFPQGKFRDDGAFSSSGSYRLLSLGKDGALLEIRETPFKKKDSPFTVKVENVSISDLSDMHKPHKTIVNVGSSSNPLGDIRERYEVIEMPPSSLASLVLNPKSSFFGTDRNRHAFATRFNGFLGTQAAQESGFKFSDGFYLAAPLPKHRYREEVYHGNKKVRIGFPLRPLWNNSKKFYEDAFHHTLGSAGIEYEFIYPDKGAFRTARSLAEDDTLDIWISGVYGGATYDPSAVKMMFCSNLGVNFPDPSGRICSLVEKTIDQSEALRTFGEILVDDACVLPFRHDGQMLLVSRDIDLNSIPKSFVYPRFENVQSR